MVYQKIILYHLNVIDEKSDDFKDLSEYDC
jgi:hypothetical protein